MLNSISRIICIAFESISRAWILESLEEILEVAALPNLLTVDTDENISPGENPIFAILTKNTSLQTLY